MLPAFKLEVQLNLLSDRISQNPYSPWLSSCCATGITGRCLFEITISLLMAIFAVYGERNPGRVMLKSRQLMHLIPVHPHFNPLYNECLPEQESLIPFTSLGAPRVRSGRGLAVHFNRVCLPSKVPMSYNL